MAIGWQVRGKPLSAVFLAALKPAAAPTRNPCIKRCETRGSWLPCVKAKFESPHIFSIRRKTWIDSLSSWRRRDMSPIDERLKSLDIVLPDIMPPVVDGYAPAFAPFTRSGDQIHLSGRIGKEDGKLLCGKMGDELSGDQGRLSAPHVAIELL